MSPVETAFLAIALIIFIGYLGMLFFNKTKISEIIILLLVGLIAGPVLGFVSPEGVALFNTILPFFASFALIVILFEGGLQLNFFKIIKAFKDSFIFTIIVFILSLIFSVIILYGLSILGFLQFDFLTSLLLGAILGGTSSAVIIPLTRSTSAAEETKMLLNLESALTDALCVIVAVAIGELILLQSIDVANVGSSIIAAFSIAAVVGGAFGLVWLKILSYLQGKSYEYLMTLAALLFLYSIVSILKGNGAIAALTFGLVLGNSEDITSMLRITTRSIDGNIRSFQKEISFLVRTLFFVYLGLLFKLEYLTIPVIIVSLLLLALFIVARILGAKIISKINKTFIPDKKLISTMMARGLAAAVLVSLPYSMGINFVPDVLNQIAAITFIVILLSNVVTTVGLFISEKDYSERSKKSPGQKLIINEDITVKKRTYT